jgi:hypothetical protein
VARLTSLQIQVADLFSAARFCGHFIGLELSDERRAAAGFPSPASMRQAQSRTGRRELLVTLAI